MTDLDCFEIKNVKYSGNPWFYFQNNAYLCTWKRDTVLLQFLGLI